MRELTEDVFMIDGIGSANVFLLRGEGGFALIDTGIFMHTHALIAQLEEGGFPVSALQTILLTHCHCDHIGGVAELLRHSHAEVAAHKDDIPYILQQEVIGGPYHNMMVEEQKAMKRLHCDFHKIDITLHDGDTINVIGGLRVIHVPGHTPGSIALYQPDQKIMFFGDVIRNTKGLTVGLPVKFNIDTDQTIQDAQKLLQYPIEYALFSHGEPVLHDAGNRIRETLS